MIRDTREAEGSAQGSPSEPGEQGPADEEPVVQGDEYRYDEDESSAEDLDEEDLDEEDLFGGFDDEDSEDVEADPETDAAESVVALSDDSEVAYGEESEEEDDEPFELLGEDDLLPDDELDDDAGPVGGSRLVDADPLGLTAVGLDSAEGASPDGPAAGVGGGAEVVAADEPAAAEE